MGPFSGDYSIIAHRYTVTTKKDTIGVSAIAMRIRDDCFKSESVVRLCLTVYIILVLNCFNFIDGKTLQTLI